MHTAWLILLGLATLVILGGCFLLTAVLVARHASQPTWDAPPDYEKGGRAVLWLVAVLLVVAGATVALLLRA